MVFGATDSDARRKGETIDADIRNRKAMGERVISVAPDRPEPRTLSESLREWYEAYGKDLAPKTQDTYGAVWTSGWRRDSAERWSRT